MLLEWYRRRDAKMDANLRSTSSRVVRWWLRRRPALVVRTVPRPRRRKYRLARLGSLKGGPGL